MVGAAGPAEGRVPGRPDGFRVAFGAFRLPPVDNLLRALPVLGVTDNRRLTLWVAFGLVTPRRDRPGPAGGVRRSRAWPILGLGVGGRVGRPAGRRRGPWAGSPRRSARGPRRTTRRPSEATPGADRGGLPRPGRHARPARRSTSSRATSALAAAQGLAWPGCWVRSGGGRIGDDAGRAALLADDDGRPVRLRTSGSTRRSTAADDRPMIAGPRRPPPRGRRLGGRIIGLGAELPPNTLMRYGLADARNYDSVEVLAEPRLARPALRPGGVGEDQPPGDHLGPGPGGARPALAGACVRAVVGPDPPAPGVRSGRADRPGLGRLARRRPPGRAGRRARETLAVRLDSSRVGSSRRSRPARGPAPGSIVRQTFDPGWRAEVDGRGRRGRGPSRRLPGGEVTAGRDIELSFIYDPGRGPDRLSVASSIATLAAVFALTDFGPFRFTRIVFRRLGRTQPSG